MNILLAEDDTISRKRLAKLLTSWQHQVFENVDGLQAMELFMSSDHDFHMVITDWVMPNLSGLELVKMIRSKNIGKPYVYIIFLTGKDEKQDIVDALQSAGADDYLTKPFDSNELNARVGVGERIVNLERNLSSYSRGLELIVQQQTQVIREAREELVMRLMSSLQFKDDETGNHVRRIGAYCEAMARSLQWPDEKVEHLRIAASMHDLGKIGVPDSVLKKPARLTEEEYEIIKRHPQIGADILAGTEYPLIETARLISLHHHEKWAGNGYPNGLAGEDISMEGRIVAIADVYDALSNDRVYRPALPQKEVLDIMRQGRGSHFDPEVFDVFLELIDTMQEILRAYAD